ncbi:MAG: TolC family protein [Betaproteobacteria bacterium]|nr:TolC family protein [Betaproteobacteria bacterium]
MTQLHMGLRLRLRRKIAAVLALFALGGCASFSPDGGFGAVEQTARQHLGKDLVRGNSPEASDSIEQRVSGLLAKPLSVEDAVQIALLNNRGLQASFQELGISEAERVQAGRLPNPRFSMLRARDNDDFKIEQALTFNVMSLVIMPQVSELEQRRFARAQRALAQEVIALAAETRKSYINALAAEESLRYMGQVRAAAEAGAELGRRMAQAGNWSRLMQAREQGFYADAALNLARAGQRQRAAREKLTRLMGLWGEQTDFRLPERLPDLPKTVNDLPDVEQKAIAQRLDVQAAKFDTEALARNLGLTRTTRFINALEFGPARVLEGAKSGPYKRGYEVSFELPIFDWGTARVARAEAIYMQAVHRAAQVAIEARSEVREAYGSYHASYDIARHFRDEIVPLRKRISEENQLRYNGMLIGVFDLLADARSQVLGVNSYIEALRDFWLAQADLDMALIGKPSLNPPAATGAAVAAPAGH